MLAAENVHKRYGDVIALDGVTVHARKGETLALVGESGCGKTTLLRCFNRMVRPDSGGIQIEGRDALSGDPVEVRRRIGYVEQNGGLLPHWTVRRNVGLVPRLCEQDPSAAVSRALDLVGLSEGRVGDRYPSELSGGQRQRVSIARAIAATPRVLLLDEPFGAVDAITRADLQTAFLKLSEELDLTTILVTHDLHEAFLLADRVAVMRSGKVEQDAVPEDLGNSPATAYVRTLLQRARIIA